MHPRWIVFEDCDCWWQELEALDWDRAGVADRAFFRRTGERTLADFHPDQASFVAVDEIADYDGDLMDFFGQWSFPFPVLRTRSRAHPSALRLPHGEPERFNFAIRHHYSSMTSYCLWPDRASMTDLWFSPGWN